MLWGFPYAFLLLLGAVPLILFLHSLRPKGLKVRTTALFLWERVLKEQAVGKRVGWLLKKNLLLILQILAALILIAALADPSLLSYGVSTGDMVVVMDLSASMKAKGTSGSRFDNARKEFLALIDTMPSDQKVMVIGAGPIPRVLSAFTTDKKRLSDLAQGLQPTEAPGQVKEAILFAHSFLKRGSSDRVVVFSDAAFDGAEELPWHSSHLGMVKVEGKNHNVGIVGLEFRRLPNNRSQYEVMINVKNFTQRRVQTPLTLFVGEKAWVEDNLDIAPQESHVSIYTYEGPLEGEVTARLELEDDFPTDNQAFLVMSDSPTIRVLYAGKGNPFLERLLGSLPHVRATYLEEYSSQQRALYDIIILDGIPAPDIREGNFILINTVPKEFPLEMSGKISTPRIFPLPTKHPVTEGLSFDDLYIKEALRLIPKGVGVTLARTAEGPLLFAIEKKRLKALVLGFDLLASDLPLRVAFPVLFSNAFDWFYPKRVEFPAAAVQAGTPYALHLPRTDDQVEIRYPSAHRETLRVVSNPLPFTDTFDVGFYAFKSQNREGRFAVNLFSENESQIGARVSATDLADVEEKTIEKTNAGLSLWPFLLMGVLTLLCVEGFLVFRAGGTFYPLAFRFLTLAIVVIAMINPRLFKPTKALDVILGVDFSRSVGQEARDKALQLLGEVRRYRDPQIRTGLLFFGREPSWEFLPNVDWSLSDLSPPVGREETDIQGALQVAVAQIGEGRQGRILLVSDGNENRGEASRVVPLLRSNGVPVWVLPVNPSQGKNEIYLSDLVLPSQVDSAESFEVKGAVESLHEASARVKLLHNGAVQSEQDMKLKAGTNWISFKESLKEHGSHTFELLVESAEDGLPENNLLQGVVEVKGPPRVLYLHSRPKSQRFMSRVLKVQGYSVVEATPEERPLSLAEISTFDLLVLDNVPAHSLSHSKMESMEKYVRDLGGGLMVIGGTQSYGAGGYYRTPLERVLPVEIRPPARIDFPHLALLFLLDRSGSMGGGPSEATTKLDLAKSATAAAADLLNPSDQVGILAFDSEWEWLLPFRTVGKGEWLSERLSSLTSDGGTDLYKAMNEAHRALSSKDAVIKHLLVLSDGLTDKADFHSLVQKMAREGITVSTVGVGKDADFAILANIAGDGKGRAYVTLDPQAIPRIFTTETLLISHDLLVEKPVDPKMTAAVGPLRGFSQKSFPPLLGYVLTHARSRADLLMKVDEDPLLVSWRYGLGKVTAFTSDLSGQWGREWVRWSEFPRWASQLARSVMRTISEHKIHTELRKEGEEVKAVVDLFSREGGFINHLKLKGNLTGPAQTAAIKPFQQIAPGRYESRFSAPQRGIYLLTLYEEGEETKRRVAPTTMPYIAPYPREYRDLKPNTALLSRLAEETGGEILEPDQMDEGLKRLYTPDPSKATQAHETWWPLSSLGLFLFLADLAVRRWPARVTGP